MKTLSNIILSLRQKVNDLSSLLSKGEGDYPEEGVYIEGKMAGLDEAIEVLTESTKGMKTLEVGDFTYGEDGFD
jgi:hypothetical protein